MSGIAQHMSHLHKLIDNIALLDMLLSLATVVNRSSEPYVAPQCTQRGKALLTPALLLYTILPLNVAEAFQFATHHRRAKAMPVASAYEQRLLI